MGAEDCVCDGRNVLLVKGGEEGCGGSSWKSCDADGKNGTSGGAEGCDGAREEEALPAPLIEGGTDGKGEVSSSPISVGADGNELEVEQTSPDGGGGRENAVGSSLSSERSMTLFEGCAPVPVVSPCCDLEREMLLADDEVGLPS